MKNSKKDKKYNTLARIVVDDKDTAVKICNELKEKLPHEILQKLSLAVKEEKICVLKNYM